MAQFLDNTGLTTLTTLIKTDLATLKPSACLVTLKASGWDSTAKTQTVTVSGVSADEASCMIIPMPAVANQSAYNDAGVNAVGQSADGVTFGCDSVPSVDLKVWVTWESVRDKTPSLAYKGNILSMDLDGNGAKQYRVLSMNGDVAKVMAMYDTLTSKYNATSTTTTMGTLTVQKYEGSTLDTYLNTTWYNTLTSATKAAIVPESVVCDAWYWGNTGDPDYSGTYGDSVPGTGNYTISKYAGGTLNIGERNVFALGVQDVIDYLNDSSVQVDTTAILRNVNIWKMFWNVETKPTRTFYLWLRSSRAGGSSSAWRVPGASGYLYDSGVNGSNTVRPALNLNLNQIDFTIVS